MTDLTEKLDIPFYLEEKDDKVGHFKVQEEIPGEDRDEGHDEGRDMSHNENHNSTELVKVTYSKQYINDCLQYLSITLLRIHRETYEK